MRRVLCIVATVAIVVGSMAYAKPERRPAEPEQPKNVRDLTGLYSLAYKGSDGSGVVQMKIWNQTGDTFRVGIAVMTGNPSVDWEGRGVIDGDRGHYNWTFPDGKSGTTTFTLDKDGRIHDQVRGGGIDWDYVGELNVSWHIRDGVCIVLSIARVSHKFQVIHNFLD
jgi:hypothetical protein